MAFRWFFLFLFPFFLHAAPGYFEPWGKDQTLLTKEAPTKSSPTFFDKAFYLYQTIVSPIDGPRSHFRPTSSRYMQLAIQRYGFLQGYLMGCDRLLRENDEKWIYQTIQIDDLSYKYDPAWKDKHILPK